MPDLVAPEYALARRDIERGLALAYPIGFMVAVAVLRRAGA